MEEIDNRKLPVLYTANFSFSMWTAGGSGTIASRNVSTSHARFGLILIGLSRIVSNLDRWFSTYSARGPVNFKKSKSTRNVITAKVRNSQQGIGTSV